MVLRFCTFSLDGVVSFIGGETTVRAFVRNVGQMGCHNTTNGGAHYCKDVTTKHQVDDL